MSGLRVYQENSSSSHLSSEVQGKSSSCTTSTLNFTMKAPTITLLALVAFATALPLSSKSKSSHSLNKLLTHPLSERIYIPEETRIATAYPESEAQVAKEAMAKRIYIPEETRIATAYPESEAQVAKESVATV